MTLERDLETPIVFDSDPLPPADVVIVCSDFLYPTDALSALFSGIEADVVHAYALYDPAEDAFPYQGSVRFHDLAGGQDCRIENAQALRPEYQSRYTQHFDALQRLTEQRGWDFSRQSTETSLAVSFSSVAVAS
jgi:uncharacterized protein (DUF58 family)